MKTHRNLYPRICAFENLYLAFIKARRGKRGRPDVAAFEGDLEFELPRIREELESESYRPGAYRHFAIYETKPRHISAAPFRDRVVHHALCNVIEPIWEARFIHDSYACRKGKGSHAALDRCTRFARRYRYVLQCDIVRFFPSVDHEILHRLLGRYIREPRTLALMKGIIDSGDGVHGKSGDAPLFSDDDLLVLARPRGLPIGNQTSQFWANVYLHPLDEFIKRELHCPAYLRYCDDFLLFADDKPTLHRWRREIEGFLVSLRLRIHSHKTAVFPVGHGIPLFGIPGVSGLHRTIRACLWHDGRVGPAAGRLAQVIEKNSEDGRVGPCSCWGQSGKGFELKRARVRGAYRNRNHPRNRNDNRGFRCCVTTTRRIDRFMIWVFGLLISAIGFIIASFRFGLPGGTSG